MSHVSIISRGSLLSTPERTLVGCSVPPIIQMGAPPSVFSRVNQKKRSGLGGGANYSQCICQYMIMSAVGSYVVSLTIGLRAYAGMR